MPKIPVSTLGSPLFADHFYRGHLTAASLPARGLRGLGSWGFSPDGYLTQMVSIASGATFNLGWVAMLQCLSAYLRIDWRLALRNRLQITRIDPLDQGKRANWGLPVEQGEQSPILRCSLLPPTFGGLPILRFKPRLSVTRLLVCHHSLG